MKTDNKKVEDNSDSKLAQKNILYGFNKGDFPIVGIGASAGGLETLEQFFC